jgi:hypothetical protein
MCDLRHCLDIDICAAVFFYNWGLSRLPLNYQYPAVPVTLRKGGGRQEGEASRNQWQLPASGRISTSLRNGFITWQYQVPLGWRSAGKVSGEP